MSETERALHTKQVTVRVTDELYEMLDKTAREMNVSVSVIIKLALSEWKMKKEKELKAQ